MKSFAERNLLVVGAVGMALTGAAVLGAVSYDKIPGLSGGKHYSAYFAESGGLKSGAAVQVCGFRVGQVSNVELDGPRVLVTFDVDSGLRLGEGTEAAIKTKSLLGAKILEVTPRGDGRLSHTIPLDHTTPPYQLPDALGELTTTISGLNTDQVSDSLRVLAKTLRDTPPSLRIAVEGVARFSQTLDARDDQLRKLLENANTTTRILARRTDEVVSLVTDTNALLAQLRSQSDALDHIAGNISSLSRQLSRFAAENRAQLRPTLDKLNDVLTVVDNRKERVQKSIKLLNMYAMSLGESVSSGPFFKAYVANLIPGQFIQPFVDAAFSDLGVDPATLLPSQVTDPQTGQPATPALPMPYPRTGQGGQPRLTLPDAITGKPGDPRYPYREPPPAPPLGGPPPGPPSPTSPPPAPPTLYVPAPGEVPAPHVPGAGQ
jgi:phospholipid/cholesterol/gamma-HCH transport system substrate-binding protein